MNSAIIAQYELHNMKKKN